MMIVAVSVFAAGAVKTLEPKVGEALQEPGQDQQRNGQSGPSKNGQASAATTNRLFRVVSDPCEDLFVGDGRIVNLPYRKSPTKVNATYAVHRKTQNQFEVMLNLKFAPAQDYDGQASRGNVDQHYRRHAAQCIREYGSRLRDQRGRAISLKIISPTDASLTSVVPRSPLIHVSQAGIRDSSRRWSSDIACPVVLHELMHLVGLVDEYEPVPAWKRQETHDCRITGPASSLMRSSWSVRRHSRVLWPAHLNAVIYPTCREKNVRYHTCSKGAYRGAKRNDGCPDWDFRERLLCYEQCTEGDCDWLQ